MGYNLHMNGVLTGSINSFCLACEVFLESEQEATEHITTLLHRKKLGMVSYSDKFTDEHIRKFRNGYFCEFCNTLLPIAAKVSLHITDEEHKQNKGILLLKPVGHNVVAFNNILIDEKVWHGLMEEICSVCNTEFDDEEQHKRDIGHSLNLVLKPVKFGSDNAIYRKIDDSAVQCLTCNELLTPTMMTKHFNDKEHQVLYSKRRIQSNSVCTDTEKNKTVEDNNIIENSKTPVIEKDKEIKHLKMENDSNNNKQSTVGQKSKILESLVRYQSKGININLETETAFCKKCSEVIKFDIVDIENHIENHSSTKKVDSELQYPSIVDRSLNRVNINDKSTKQSEESNLKGDVADENIKMLPEIPDTEKHDSETSDSTQEEANNACCSSCGTQEKNTNKYDQEAKDFAKENRINLNEGNNDAFCLCCEVRLPSSYKSMKEHVAGVNHKSKSDSKKVTEPSKTNLPKQANPVCSAISKREARYYVESAYDIEGLFTHETIVNEEFCLPQFSFWLITKNNSKLRCLVCEVYLPPTTDFVMHVNTKHHAIKMGMTPIITSEKSEFIREIRPGLFHCGFCNLVVSSWTEMKQHLKCSDHKERRAIGERRLAHHLPELQEYKRHKHNLETMQLLWMLNRLS